jgi:predicted regulator of Ras-like GTPase activity (Roadblock/LC7/MglB family)
MKSILKKIVALRGVHYACICKSGEVLASTFPESNKEGIANAIQAIEQMFSALQVIGKAHNEIYFSLGEMQLIGYQFADEYLVVLLADDKINLPLIHMGVKSASVKIKALSFKQESSPQAVITPVIENTPSTTADIIPQNPPIQANKAVATISPTVQSVMDNIKELLIDYLGPAAIFVFDDGVDLWREKYMPTESTLIYLVEILALELNAGDERNDFIAKAKGYL